MARWAVSIEALTRCPAFRLRPGSVGGRLIPDRLWLQVPGVVEVA